MADTSGRLHLQICGATPAELGLSRGRQLRSTLAAAYRGYADLFRAVGVTQEQELQAVAATLAVLEDWRPELLVELRGIAEGAGVTLAQVAALNARTEILAMGQVMAHECSTIAAPVAGRMLGVQTWDWHIELDPFWHTQQVCGSGHSFVGVTEQGIISKIGVNEAGLALHFNILGHADDAPGGVPMHLLAATVLRECASVAEGVALVRGASITSSSSFTLIDRSGAVSLEITPVGVFEIAPINDAVVRTNHFFDPRPLAGQKGTLEPDSSARYELLRERLSAGVPQRADRLLALLESDASEPPLSHVPDMSRPFGERWATLCTTLSDPAAKTLRVLDGMPTEAVHGVWRELTVCRNECHAPCA